MRKPNRRAPAYIGGFVSQEQKRRMEELASARQTSMTGLLREIADHAVVAVVLPQKESSVVVRQDYTGAAGASISSTTTDWPMGNATGNGGR